MPCIHLKQLFQLCQDNELRVTGAELVHFVCEKCNQQEVCPSNLMDTETFAEEGDEIVANEANRPQPATDTSTAKDS